MLMDRSHKARSLCSTLAIATTLLVGSGAAQAQSVPGGSFQGAGTFTFGNGTIFTTTGTTDIRISTPQAVIDWTMLPAPTADGRVIFQPAGTTATFTNNPDTTSNFAVLNRIIPANAANPIQFDGRVVSQLQSFSTTTGATAGGTVFFYSPGGIIIGSNAVFDVGNLGLTTSPVAVDANGTWLGANNRVSFGLANPATSVIINQGAKINAPAPSSYIGVVAPKVFNNGAITVNGSAALVGADAANITFNMNGLFDIQVTAGSSDTSGFPVSMSSGGSITGPAGSGLASSHRAYLVAVPRNTALTMAITQGSTLGFDIAGAADIVGNVVILSAGHNIASGEVAGRSAGAGSGVVDINIENSTVTSRFQGVATGGATAFSQGGGRTSFASSLLLRSPTAVKLSSDGSGSSTSVANNVTLQAQTIGSGPGEGARAGGLAQVTASNSGSVSIGGSVQASANGRGGDATLNGVPAGSGTGGVVTLQALSGGNVSIADNATVSAEGTGGIGLTGGGLSGAGIGGLVQILVRDPGSNLNIRGGAGNTSLSASGFGGTSAAGSSVTGGSGTGGRVQVLVNGGNATLNLAGNTTLAAEGTGSSGGIVNGVGGPGGNGTGGTIVFNGATGTGNVINAMGTLVAVARGFGGSGTNSAPGTGVGGDVRIGAGSGTRVTVARALTAETGGFGGFSSGTLAGGSGTGGRSLLNIFGAGGAFNAQGGVSINSIGRGGGSSAGTGGAGNGGTAQIFQDQGTITIAGTTRVDATGSGGGGSSGGNGRGGTASIAINGLGTLNLTAPQTFNNGVYMAADGLGGSANASGGVGGSAQGGDARIVATGGGMISLNARIDILSRGSAAFTGAAGTDGGNATGGTASISQGSGGRVGITGDVVMVTGSSGGSNFGGGDLIGGTGTGGDGRIAVNDAGGIVINGNVNISSGGFGGGGRATSGVSSGGNGVGGLANIGAINGALIITGQAQIFGGGGGGSAMLDGSGGTGIGGSALIGTVAGAAAGTITIGGLGGFTAVNATGNGGSAAGAGNGGNAIAGTSQIFASGGNVTLRDAFSVDAGAFGGSAVNGNGGNATGGLALISTNNLHTAAFTNASTATVRASATGGTASGLGDGGDAGAGRARLFINSGNITIAGGVSILGEARGGAGVNGGDALSVQPFRQPRALIAGSNGNIAIGGFTSLSSNSTGGDGHNGGQGGLGFAGNAAVEMQSTDAGASLATFNGLRINAVGTGGRGGDGLAGQAGGTGGDGYGAFASVTGNAGNGRVVVTGDTSLRAEATGGAGGAGGSGATTAPGGVGGAGGRAFGGGTTVGTVSGAATVGNTGAGTFDNVNTFASALGGAGGAGGSGSALGVGGAGGDAFGGGNLVLVRGSSVAIDNYSGTANGTGGAGGAGSTQGAGGDGAAGGGSLIVTQRFMRTERGLLNAGNVSFATAGVGGAGSTPGIGYYYGSSGAEEGFFIRQSDVNLNSYSYVNSGITAPNYTVAALQVGFESTTGIPTATNFTIVPDPLDLTLLSSTVDVAAGFTMITPGDIRVSLDGSTLSAGDLLLDAGNFVLPATAPVATGTISVDNTLRLISDLDIRINANFTGTGNSAFFAPGAFEVGNFTTTGTLDVTALSITTGAIQASEIDLFATQSVVTAALTATGGGVDITANGAVTTGAITASTSIDLEAAGAISTAALTAGDSVTAQAVGALSVGNISAGIVNPSSSTGADYTIALRSLNSIRAGTLDARLNVGLSSSGTISVGNISAGLYVLGLAGTGFTSGSITTPQTSTFGTPQTYIANVSMERLGGLVGAEFNPLPIFAASPVAIGGPISIGGPVTTGTFQAATTQGFTSGTITASTLRIMAGLAITTGALSAAERIDLTSGASLSFGDITTSGGLFIDSGGSLTTGNVQARQIGLKAVGDITTGSLTASDSVFANSGGSIAFNGAVQARSIRAASAMNFSAGAITFPSSQSLTNDLLISAGGLIAVNGAWRADFISLKSNDIDIASTGTLTGFVDLISTNRTMAVIGDISSTGATQPGSGAYRLTDAEFDRISGGFSFGALDNAGEVDLLIGDLSVDATRFSADGEVFVYSGDSRNDDELVGRIRVDGNLAITGVANGTPGEESFFVGFFSKSFELNAATGSVTIAGANGALAGALEIEADNIHVASDAILLKLRADPFYEGSVQELNSAAAVQRPDGVLRANSIELEGNRTIYIQNTGSTVVPAGFVTRVDNDGEGTSIGPEDRDPSPSSEQFKIVINGKVQTETGLVTGKAAFDLIIAAARADLDPGEVFGIGLDPGSTLNGCGITTGVCAFSQSDPVSSISSEVRLAIVNQLADAPVPDVIEEAADSATESADDEASQSAEDEDEAEADEASSPIAPPAPLINTRSLNPAVRVVEPVAGSGNPALIGSAVNEATAQGDTP